MIPFLARGNDELKDNENIGKFAECPCCGRQHKVKYGEIINEVGNFCIYGRRAESKNMAFVTCKGNSYIVGINGKRLK